VLPRLLALNLFLRKAEHASLAFADPDTLANVDEAPVEGWNDSVAEQQGCYSFLYDSALPQTGGGTP
jgi:hypothetical protein